MKRIYRNRMHFCCILNWALSLIRWFQMQTFNDRFHIVWGRFLSHYYHGLAIIFYISINIYIYICSISILYINIVLTIQYFNFSIQSINLSHQVGFLSIINEICAHYSSFNSIQFNYAQWLMFLVCV